MNDYSDDVFGFDDEHTPNMKTVDLYQRFAPANISWSEWVPITRIEPNIYLGGVHTPSDDPVDGRHMDGRMAPHCFLETYGIRAVVSLTDLPVKWNVHPDIRHLHYPVLDYPTTQLKPYFDEAASFIEECLKEGRGIFVHCHMGISRSTTMLIAYYMKCRGMTLQHAIQRIQSSRSFSLPNIGFIKQLVLYEKELASARMEN